MNTEKLHILILCNSFPSIYQPLAGIFWKEQSEYMSSMGHNVGVIAITPISIKDILKKGGLFSFRKIEKENHRIWHFSYPNIPGLYFLSCYITKFIGFHFYKNYCKKFQKPNIIHVHRFEAGLLANRIKIKYKIPFVVTEHSSKFLYNQLSYMETIIAKKIFIQANHRIAVSNHLKTVLENQFNLPFTITPNGVDCSYFISNVKENPINNDFTIFSAGNLTVNKNHALLIHSFLIFNQTYPLSKLIIAGEGPERENLETLISNLNLSNNVILIGRLDRESIRKYYSQMDLFVLPSHQETFGVVVIEALSSGKPVVSTKCGGPEEIITENFLGILCESNVDELYNAIQEVYLNYRKYNSKKIRDFTLNNFDQKKITYDLLEMYDTVISDI